MHRRQSSVKEWGGVRHESAHAPERSAPLPSAALSASHSEAGTISSWPSPIAMARPRYGAGARAMHCRLPALDCVRSSPLRRGRYARASRSSPRARVPPRDASGRRKPCSRREVGDQAPERPVPLILRLEPLGLHRAVVLDAFSRQHHAHARRARRPVHGGSAAAARRRPRRVAARERPLRRGRTGCPHGAEHTRAGIASRTPPPATRSHRR